MAVDRKNLCPNCGAPLSGMELKCPECGYIFSKESLSSEQIRDEIASLQEKVLSAKTPSDKASVIGSFTLPHTFEGLLNLLDYSYTSFERCNGLEDEIISSAWLGKSKQAYRTLKQQVDSDKVLQSQIERYSFLDNQRTAIKAKESKAKKKKRSTIKWIVIVVIFVIAIYLFLMVVSSLDESSTDTDIRQDVMELIEEGKYDEARTKAMSLEYSWEQKEMIEIIEKAENK